MIYDLFFLAKLCKFTKSLCNCKFLRSLFPYAFIFSAWINTNSLIYNFSQTGCLVVLTICNILIINSLTRTTLVVPRLSLPFFHFSRFSRFSRFSINRLPRLHRTDLWYIPLFSPLLPHLSTIDGDPTRVWSPSIAWLVATIHVNVRHQSQKSLY